MLPQYWKKSTRGSGTVPRKTNRTSPERVDEIPSEYVQNGDERLLVLNAIANNIVSKQRGKNTEHVFTYNNTPITRMLNTAWIRAIKSANLEQVRVHDLKHTLGIRLRSAGVSFQDRQNLLDHRSGRITTHYSAAELSRLIEAANEVRCQQQFSQRRNSSSTPPKRQLAHSKIKPDLLDTQLAHRIINLV